MVIFVNSPRELRGNDDCPLQFAVANILDCLLLVVVVNRNKGANVSANGIESFAYFKRLRASILVDNAEPGVANFAPESVAQNDELNQGKDHGCEHQRGRAEELPHFALDNGHHSIHSIYSNYLRSQTRALWHYKGISFL